MTKLKFIVILIILFVALGLIFIANTFKATNTLSQQKKSTIQLETPEQITPQIVEKQASFAIFTNGTLRVFTATMYHNLSSDIYIEASSPGVIQIKKAGLTWHDFFSTLPLKLTHECLTTGTGQTFCTGLNGTLKFYINGKKSVNALDQRVNNGDKLLVTFGSESEIAIKKQFDQIPN